MENYLIVRTHGLKLRLLKPEDYNRLLTASLKELPHILSTTDYRDVIEGVRVEEINSHAFFKILFGKYLQRVNLLSEFLSEDLRKLIKAYALGRYEAENIKNILIAIASEEPISVQELYPVEMHFPIDHLANIREIDDVIDILRRLGWHYSLRAFEMYGLQGYLSIIECSVDADYFSSLYKLLKKVPHTKKVKRLIDLESDLCWLYWVIVFKMKNIDITQVRHFLGSLGKNLRRVEYLIEDASIDDIPTIIAHVHQYEDLRDILSRAIREHDYVLIEYGLSSKLYHEAIKTLRHNFMDLAYVFAYLLISEMELHNLYMIFAGKKANLSTEEIQRFLYLQ